MRTPMVPLALIIVVLSGCGTTPKRNVTSDLTAATLAWQKGWTALADPATGTEVPFDVSKRLSGVYVTDERLLSFDLLSPVQTRITGWAAFKQAWGPFMQNVSNLRWSPLADFRHGGEGNTGWSAGTVHVSGTVGNAPIDTLVHATLIWERTPKGWRILHEHISLPVKDSTSAVVDPRSAIITQ